MFLDDFNSLEEQKKLQRLVKTLSRDYGVDFSIYESLSSGDLSRYIKDLEQKKTRFVSESSFNSHYNDADYARTSLLVEALIILREISPKRKPRKLLSVGSVNESTSYKNREVEKPMTKKIVKEDEAVEKAKTLSELLELTLFEENNELVRAEVVLASQDLVGTLQKMVEDIGRMGTEDIMPMVDGIRNYFSPSLAAQFSRSAEQHIQKAADGLQEFKDSMEQYSKTLEARISDEDAHKPINDMTGEMPAVDVDPPIGAELAAFSDEEGDEVEDLASELGGEDAEGEPLGRAKKESRVVTIGGSKVKLTNEQIAYLAKARKIMEKVKNLNEAASAQKVVVLTVHGKRVRLTEGQVKALLFAKNFRKIVEGRNANNVKLSESQAKNLVVAKKLVEKIKSLSENKESIDELSEKWAGHPKVKKLDKWGDYSIAELTKKARALRDKEDKTAEESTELRQINFAIRAKRDWKGGEGAAK